MGDRSADGVDVVPATTAQLASYTQAKAQLDAFKVPALYDSKDIHARVFFALFDGTGNDAIKDPEHITNVGRLISQIEDAERKNPNIGHFYLEGPGTQPGLAGLWDRITGGTYTERIDKMYGKFIAESARWLKDDPDAKISVVSVGFSRGAEQAAGFSRMVDELGIQDPRSQIIKGERSLVEQISYAAPALRAEGTIAQALGLYDPVATGVPSQHDRRPPPSVVSGIQIKAADEHRTAFPSTAIIEQGVSMDGRFMGVTTAGAHSDIGGGYILDGLAKRNFNLMTQYLNGVMGEPSIKEIKVERNPYRDVIHDSTQHQWFYIETSIRKSVSELNPNGEAKEPMDHALVAPYLRKAALQQPGGSELQGTQQQDEAHKRAEAFKNMPESKALAEHPELAPAFAAYKSAVSQFWEKHPDGKESVGQAVMKHLRSQMADNLKTGALVKPMESVAIRQPARSERER